MANIRKGLAGKKVPVSKPKPAAPEYAEPENTAAETEAVARRQRSNRPETASSLAGLDQALEKSHHRRDSVPLFAQDPNAAALVESAVAANRQFEDGSDKSARSDPATELNANQARQAVVGHNVSTVLVVSLVSAVVILIALYLVYDRGS